MSEVGGVDASGGAYDLDAPAREDDDALERLRRQEAALGAAYRRDPGDVATMGAPVRVQQQLRKHAEDASRLADNAATPLRSLPTSRREATGFVSRSRPRRRRRFASIRP